jgi:DNA polymerase/3'-5' exonuclease PolX
MGEIKSTLELVMERTRGVAITEEEKREMKKKEILVKAAGLSNRYRESQISLNEVLKEIEKMEEKRGTELKEILLSHWIAALSMSDEDERLLEGVEALRHRSLENVKQKFCHLLSEYKREKEMGRQEAQAQMAEILRGEGIAGSALEPNAERCNLWEENLKRLALLYGKELEKIKAELRTL